MNLMLAVVDDLATFAIHSLRKGVRRIERTILLPQDEVHTVEGHQEVIFVSPRPERLAITAPTDTEHVEELPHARLDEVLEPVMQAPKRNTVIYVATHDAPLRSSPEHGIDNVIERMHYGGMLVAMETTGDWVHVFYRGVEGYAELRDLAAHAGDVYPKFVIGEENGDDDPNTERVRAMIGDEFSCGEGGLPLQAEEYALYKLLRAGITPEWTKVRPRRAGTWASSLDGTVERLIEPAPRTLIEWMLPNGRGHIAFVESVLPDGTLSISEANWPEGGTYNERVLVREEWLALAPTFLRFS